VLLEFFQFAQHLIFGNKVKDGDIRTTPHIFTRQGLSKSTHTTGNENGFRVF
jgi:hypothetical protein